MNNLPGLFTFIVLCIPISLLAQTATPESMIQQRINQFKTADHDGVSLLPPSTTILQVKVRDGTIDVWLSIPFDFLENEFDELTHEEIVETLAASISQFSLYNLRLKVKNRQGQVVDLSRFLPDQVNLTAAPQKNNEPLPARKGNYSKQRLSTQNQVQPVGSLTGKTVWLSAGHGWQYNPRLKKVSTQRHKTHGIVEDFVTAEFVNYHLLQYLYRAGANVWTVRERDMNTHEIIVDNDSKRFYSETGRWSRSQSKGYKGKSYRYAISSKKESATAIYNPEIPKSGMYWVSVYYTSGVNRSVDTRYRIEHAGGASEVSINQETHGNTWVYLGQFYFEKGNQGKVIVSNASNEKGQAIIVDAVRFGGGKGNLADCRYQRKSGLPRFEEAARYYAPFQGFPKCINDVSIRPAYAEWELSKGSQEEKRNAIYLSLHTNANGNGGTESYIHNYRSVKGSRSLQNAIHQQLISDIRNGGFPNWKNRGQKKADFGELRGLHTMPGILMELGFHDHKQDAHLLSSPEFRDLAARSIYKGVARYFAQREGRHPIYLPEPPTHLYAKSTNSKSIALRWKTPAFGGVLGDAARRYKVYISRHGRAFAESVVTDQTSFTFKNLKAGTTYYFTVCAINNGGASKRSAVVAVRTPDNNSNQSRLLIVDGFDRLDRGLSLLKSTRSSLGSVRRLPLEQMNHYDYMYEHGHALAANNVVFDGASNEAVNSGWIQLKDYEIVNWFTGRESVNDQTLNRQEQAILKKYLQNGGNLILSGSEIGFDLVGKNNGRAFFESYLKARYIADDARANRYNGSDRLVGRFNNDAYGIYPAFSPDVIKAWKGSRSVLQYPNGSTAAIAYRREYGLVYFGFPLETVGTFQQRAELFRMALDVFEGRDRRDISLETGR